MKYKNNELEEYSGNTSSRFNDLSNQQFGGYYIICRGPNKKGHTMYWCECICGKIELKYANHIKTMKRKMCLQCAMDEISKESFEGCGNISYAYWNDLKRGAAGNKSSRKSRRIIKFDINIEDAWNLFIKQNRKCALSGLPISFVIIGRSNKQRMKKQTASLDRIDSNKDYTIDNVQWVHKHINIMKNIYSNDYFIEMCKNVANNKENK